ncbi:MAG TPA: class I SAM-dependent methyltransferase [Candidatus Methylomirabilis sp.]|nr:class I SAM-dependent methyltransferase [Candidatus Methylomirabilis sp.]
MAHKSNRAQEIQRKYYTESASSYEQMHEHEGSGDPLNTKFVQSILRMVEARSVLDVGTATGRGMKDLKDAVPTAFVCGIEPVVALVEQAVRKGNTASGPIILGSGSALPFKDASFDVVCEFAVLHHVPDPNAVVKEMLRVAKKAVLISDSNRFGQGSRLARLIKLGLYKSRLWATYNFVRTSGKGYQITEGDGLAYSYSIYDSFDLVARWADRIILYSASDKTVRSWVHPLLTSGGALLCALRDSV